MRRPVLWLLLAAFLILVGAQPAVGEATIGLALRGAAVLAALIPTTVWLLAGGWLALRRTT